MSKTPSKKMDRGTDDKIAQFIGITGASPREAKRYIAEHKRVDYAVDAYYNEQVPTRPVTTATASTSKLNSLFDKYKDPDGEDITYDGTIKLCEDLKVDPEDVVLLSIAYELKSPRMGEWTRKGWLDGWKKLNCDTTPGMSTTLVRLRDKLASDSEYFTQVYNFTFEFSRPPGQRSLGIDMAHGFWSLLLPHGLQGGAVSHVVRSSDSDDGSDDPMTGVDEEGWREEHTQLWLDFIEKKGGKGVSKDTWHMFLDFVRTIDSKFQKYDVEAAWPSLIDDFVQHVKEPQESHR